MSMWTMMAVCDGDGCSPSHFPSLLSSLPQTHTQAHHQVLDGSCSSGYVHHLFNDKMGEWPRERPDWWLCHVSCCFFVLTQGVKTLFRQLCKWKLEVRVMHTTFQGISNNFWGFQTFLGDFAKKSTDLFCQSIQRFDKQTENQPATLIYEIINANVEWEKYNATIS